MELIESVTSDSIERRRMQNRAAQRKFRQKRSQQRAAEKALGERSTEYQSIPGSGSINPQEASCPWPWTFSDQALPSALVQTPQQTSIPMNKLTSYRISPQLDHVDSLISPPSSIHEASPIWGFGADEMFMSNISSPATSPMESIAGSYSSTPGLIPSSTDQISNLQQIQAAKSSHMCSIRADPIDDSELARVDFNRTLRSKSNLVSTNISHSRRTSLPSGNPISATDSGWLSTMHIAAQKGRDRIVRILLQRGVPFDEKDEDGRTPLTLATIEGHVQVVAALLKKGARINVYDHEGRSALHWAVIKCNEPILSLLLENSPNSPGFNVDSYDNVGWTPLHLAVDRGFEAGMMLLLQCGANLNFKARRCPDSGNVIPMDHGS